MSVDRSGLKKFDAIVVGAGVSGLTASLVLAKNGLSTALVEKQAYIGPLLHRFKRSGVWCDPAFHYSGGLGSKGTLTVLFRYLGMADDIETISLPSRGFDVIVQDGQIYRIPFGFKRLQVYLIRKFPGSAPAIKMYIQKLSEVSKATGFLNFDLNFDDFSVELFGNQSLESFLLKNGAEPGLIRLLGNHGLVLYGASAAEVPLFVNASIMGSFYQHADAIRGGGSAILEGFKSALKKENVSLYLGDGLNRFEVDQKRNIKGVWLESGRLLEANNCVSTLHPWDLADKLPKERVRPAFISRLKSLENTFSPFIAFYKLHKIPAELQESNFYVFKQEAPFLDIAFMAANQKAEFKGAKALVVLKPVPADFFAASANGLYHKQKEQMRQKVTQQMLTIFPELEGNNTYLDGATAKSINRYTSIPEGAIYGIKPTIHQMNLSAQTSVRGLYMAGQSVQSGVMGAMISAFMAAGNIVGLQKLRKQVVQWR